ncbi:potassium-transporting ATPase subunit KdpA [Umezakia ovalisporum]|jgi:K+-transporting ATPase ATPase A chain|uniref:Potassium-transporting ATPase potassium-binding subunit n=2 Tax=Umezakia ovalisporum TaxID=75695 RepID=A0AA43H030_9CYAN|nr:potassium-transporting ATPase subunit KdpA [Umezakia ovalisporum]MBI1241929.1 potassium-transporting ATPase subunit A [Nostoc sp. RI_552]MDH6058530.1 potassium-transporting ATPase subunit KdpA [Umezakia ovalisporum FSS-43]MDH6064984.1 potassium-transporting ATPase subunit KdpA [Umezakia ovalisporum FSS-62]MDH6069453.1 potassium-transporting ATPase subunit KdpA [Umezakia ovalisporum CobakiLakeA]MDH6075419.1 potassium-transporting ATPase subunit KdpA [Umezakia ovalisporum CS-1034]
MLQGSIQITLTLVIVIATTPVLGKYIARVFMGEQTLLDPIINPLERVIYIFSGVSPQENMTGKQYAKALLYSNLVMGILVYLILMLQRWLPLNPTGLNAPSWDLGLHTAISFITNTNQQHYSGETTLSYGSQIFALGFVMFTSAATGLSVSIAFIRGLTGRLLGNFYSDLIRSITRMLLPICIIGGLLLLLAGVPETLAPPAKVTTLEGETQVIARGPVAHYEIIKELGENGGGFFGSNSAHPFENPSGFSNLLETWAMISIPSALIYAYGVFTNNRKQAWLVFAMVLIIFVFLVVITAVGEFQGNPLVNRLLGEQQPNLEGKEVRFGWGQTALWAVMTTATMCGAVNGMQDSLMPPGGFATLFNMFLQIIWGGQGTGTAFLFIYLILAVFLTSLMVGRTPEFLGRKIEKKEILLASVILLVHPFAILIPSAVVFAFPDALSGISNPGFHGVSQVVYEYASAAANNGSGLEGLNDNTLWWNLSAAASILAGRYIPIIALLLLADSMSRKQAVPITVGTLRTDTKLFTGVTGSVILILGALTFFPVLILGPIAEAFQLAAKR